jgi:hypothetical protein
MTNNDKEGWKEVEDIEEPFFKETSSTHRPQVHH